ncbi:MAG: VWA domain-containing protein [Prevotella sp.]|nr:VWA domain-containing protein [Staphylococcus sp.]MCM1350173.1 VWA domain-containing protein [Prevotella sp.]
MTILNPWALLSLASLIVLLLIYILKPNFQQKFVSSTYVWKLSLKYKKKKLPINKLRNLLLIICQVLILTLLSVVLVKPVKVTGAKIDNEVILILDASASMRTKYEETTRFERAIELVQQKAKQTFDADGIVSIVVASHEPYFIAERLNASSRWDVEETLNEMKEQQQCTYGSSNLDDATGLCQDIISENPNALIFVYTDSTVNYVTEGLEIINVQQPGEFNIAILDAYAEIIDNYYSYVVKVACYGMDVSVDLTLDVYGANATESSPSGVDFQFVQGIDLNNDKTIQIVFINSDIDLSNLPEDENTIYYQIPENEKIFSYESIHLGIDADDCFDADNTFDIYGGTKEVINVLYASSNANSFFNGILFVLKNALQDRFNIQITEVKKGELPNSGYDLYIYEHEMMPATAPTDGVVIYADPQMDVAGSGFRIGNNKSYNQSNLPLTEEAAHLLTKSMVADNITVSRIMTLVTYDEGYQTLMSCDEHPVLLVKDEENIKSVVMLFSLHYSNMPIINEFPIFMFNIFDYFLPATIDGNSFEVNDRISIRSRSNEIIVEGYGEEIILDTFPNTISLSLPGTYTITQTTYFGNTIKEQVYAKIPNSESNIFNEIDTIMNPINGTSELTLTKDLLFWVAIGLSALVFIEWILKGKDTI